MYADDTTIPLPAIYVEAADPTTIYTDGRSFVKRLWRDTSTGTIGTLKIRNAANDGWTALINLDVLVPAAHASTHQNGGADEINVAGLSGVLADPQVPITESVQDIVGALFIDNSDLDLTYDDGAGTVVATIKPSAAPLSPATITLTDGATVTWATGGARQNNARVTLGGNRTLDITGEVDGATGLLIVKQDGTGGRTLTLPGSSLVINDGGGTVTLSTGANEIDILTWYYDGTNFFWTIGVNYS